MLILAEQRISQKQWQALKIGTRCWYRLQKNESNDEHTRSCVSYVHSYLGRILDIFMFKVYEIFIMYTRGWSKVKSMDAVKYILQYTRSLGLFLPYQ